MTFSIFGNLLTYFKLLISGDTEGLIKFRELKQLYKTFKSSRYKYITQDKKITNLFMQKVYTLNTLINDYKVVLTTTLFASDEKKSQIFLNHFVESYIPDDIKSKREKFTKELLWKRIMEAGNVTREVKDIEDEFKGYKNFFNKHNLPKIESEYYLLYKLNALATFNFELFFSKFDSDYSPGATPSYNPVLGDDVLVDIEDLYFLISSIPNKIDLTFSLEKLYMRNQSDYKTLAKQTQNSIAKIYKLIKDDLSPHILLLLCRYITENVKHNIKIEQKFFSILDKYKTEMTNRFQRNKNFVLEKYSEKSLQQDIQSLFKGKVLHNIDSYSENLRKLIEENTFDTISGIQALKITKTFIIEIYEKYIKDIINTMIIEAFFNEKDYQTDFSNIFFAANELLEIVKECELKLSGSGKTSFNNLEVLLKNYRSSTKIGENKIKMMIESINEKIRSCNERCANILYKLANNIYNVIQDFKSPKPTYINNIKAIKGAQNKEFISQLANAYNDIAKYVKVIKNFILVKTKKNV